MPYYRYTAINKTGQRVNKVMLANNPTDVRSYLSGQNLFVVDIQDINQNLKAKKAALKTSDKVFFTQNLSVLLGSGVSLGESIATIAEDADNKTLSAFYMSLRADLERGNPLSKALSQYPSVFDPIYLSLVQAGENAGRLDTIMENLAKSLEKDVRMYSQVKSAMLYPAFVLGALMLLGLVVLFFVLPRLTRVFTDLQVDLPLVTRLIVSLGEFVGKYPVPLLSGVGVFIVLLFLYLRSSSGHRFLAYLSIRTPLIKNIINNLDLARLSSTLALLLNAGVPIQQALKISGGTIRDPKLNHEFTVAGERLANGMNLTQSFANSSLPKTFIALVSVGERSGSIAKVFANLGEHYDNLLDTSIKNFTGILEPLLTLVVGLIVGGVVITVMLPLYQVVGNLSQ